MTDTIESLREERDALKAEVERLKENSMAEIEKRRDVVRGLGVNVPTQEVLDLRSLMGKYWDETQRQAALLERVREVLDHTQFGMAGRDGFHCPDCDAAEKNGHADDCDLAALLKDMEEKP